MKVKYIFKKLWWTFFLCSSCAQVTSLNLKKHHFGVKLKKIIWIQIAGLQEEHLALLKFDYQSTSHKTSFENFTCYGKTWEYNLFKLRPLANSSFKSQLSGTSHIKGQCEDYKKKPLWSYLSKKQKFKVGIFEGPLTSSHQSLKNLSCEWNKDYLQGVNFFSHSQSSSHKEYGTTFEENVKQVFKDIMMPSPKFLYLVRDFSFLHFLKSQKIRDAKKSLFQLHKMVHFFMDYIKNNTDALLLVTTAETVDIDFPYEGDEWNHYLRQDVFNKPKRAKLISSVFSSGARSENFCGLYEQKKILERLLSAPKDQGLELEFINPF